MATIENYLDEVARKMTGGIISYCTSLKRYKNLETGQFVSRTDYTEISRRASLNRAMRIGKLIARGNAYA